MITPIPLWSDFEYKPHQTVGISWMAQKEADGGGLLCDEMGLGKTIQIVGLMKTVALKNNLLVAPLAVLEQWRETATRAGINCWMHKSGEWLPPQRLSIKNPNLYLVNYETVPRYPSLFKEKTWNRVICDEAHRICNEGSSFTRIQEIECSIHWLMTATPIVNGTKDIRVLFKMLGKQYSEKMLPDFVMCRTMEEMRAKIPSLPKKAIQIEHTLDFDTEAEADFYRGIQGLLVKRWKALGSDSGNAALDRLKLIIRLRQISLHPQVYIDSRKRLLGPGVYQREDWIDSSTKFNKIHDLIEAEEKPRKWILFCHFHKEMELLATSLKTDPKIGRVWQYNGSVSGANRTKILAETLTPIGDKHEVLLIQLQSGGVGLNLQHFSRIIFSGPWWTSALMDQAVGRAVRIGQAEQVIVHHLILKEEGQGLNIDKIIQEKAKMKGELCAKILEAANHSVM